MSKRARTRAIRAQMATTGENYTRAAAAVDRTAQTPSDRLTDDPLRVHVRRVLELGYAYDQRQVRRIDELERAGHRIVSGGQTGPDTWMVKDWRTDEVLAQGDGGFEEYEEVTERLGVPEKWFEVDNVDDDEVFPIVQTPGVPSTLAEPLQEWVETSGVPDVEVAEFVGWPEEKVRQLRGGRG